MRRALGLMVVVAACNSPTGTMTVDVTHYDYAIDLATRDAHAAITMKVVDRGNCVAIPLRAQGLANVTLNGKAVTSGTEDASSLTVCGDGWDDGDTVVLAGDVTVSDVAELPSQIGFSTTKDKDGNEFTYLVSWVNGCDQFGPCDNRPDVFATYHFDVTHDPSLTVRCPGTITDDSPTETECTFDYAGGPTYSTFGIAAYPAWTQTDLGMWSDVHVTVYDRADTGIAAAIDPAWHGGFIAFMEQQFGPWPYGSELRLLTAPTYWNGFEHPGNIVLADSLAKQVDSYADVVAHTIDHEMTHMWAGDQTTLAGTYDFAWKESMAEYMAFVWEDMNDASISATTASVWKADSSVVTHYPVPQDQPDLFAYYSDVYGPGPFVFFRQLEVLSSRAQVIAALQSVLGSPHSLSVDDLVAALAQSTGLDLDAYAAGWIEGTGTPLWPKIAASYDATTGMLHVTSSNPAMGCAFHVALVSADGSQTLSVPVDTFHNGADQMIAAAPAFAVASYTIDPDHECLVYPADAVPAVRSRRPWVAPR
jgi:aminopeptidase N